MNPTLRQIPPEETEIASAFHGVDGPQLPWPILIFRDGWRELLAWTVCGGLLFLAVALLIPKRYEAVARLMPPDPPGSSAALLNSLIAQGGGTLAAFGDMIGPRSSGATVVGILNSRTIQDDLINQLDLRRVYGEKRYEDTRRILEKRSSITEDRRSGIITIAVHEWPLLHIMLGPARIRSKALIDWCEFRSGAIFSFFQRHLPARVAGNMVNTAVLGKKLRLVSESSFHVLPSGVYLEQYYWKPATERNGILFLGRIAEHKNPELLLSAYQALLSKGYGGPLRIAGDGPKLPGLRKWKQQSKAGNSVELLGSVDEKDKRELLASSDLLVLPSRREGFPRVLAEAMASGLPVVTARYPENGAADVVDQYGIGEVAEATSDAISNAMLHALEKWDSYSAACIAASKSLDWEVLVDSFLSFAAQIARPQ